jgi:predicted N-acetyltransferase YhbS
LAKAASQDVVLREIRPEDACSGLSLGDPSLTPLKTFLRKCARRYHNECLAKTYVVLVGAPEKIIAYISLNCSVIAVEGGQPEVQDYDYQDLPAVKIARLAVDQRHQRKKLGFDLVAMAIALTRGEIMPKVGCRFIVVDSKKGSVDFYKKCGFTLLDTENNKKRSSPVMFLDLWKLP